MKLHPWSFLLGFAAALVGAGVRHRFRPVAVELAALAGHVGQATWALFERRFEAFEDFEAEVQERMRERARHASWTDGARVDA